MKNSNNFIDRNFDWLWLTCTIAALALICLLFSLWPGQEEFKEIDGRIIPLNSPLSRDQLDKLDEYEQKLMQLPIQDTVPKPDTAIQDFPLIGGDPEALQFLENYTMINIYTDTLEFEGVSLVEGEGITWGNGLGDIAYFDNDGVIYVNDSIVGIDYLLYDIIYRQVYKILNRALEEHPCCIELQEMRIERRKYLNSPPDRKKIRKN